MKTLYLKTKDEWTSFKYNDLSELKEEFEKRNIKIDYGVVIGANAKIGNSVAIGDDSEIGAYSEIGDGVVIGDYTEIGYNSKIGDGVVIGDNEEIGFDNSKLF